MMSDKMMSDKMMSDKMMSDDCACLSVLFSDERIRSLLNMFAHCFCDFWDPAASQRTNLPIEITLPSPLCSTPSLDLDNAIAQVHVQVLEDAGVVSKETNGVETDGGLKELSALAQPATTGAPVKRSFFSGISHKWAKKSNKYTKHVEQSQSESTRV